VQKINNNNNNLKLLFVRIYDSSNSRPCKVIGDIVGNSSLPLKHVRLSHGQTQTAEQTEQNICEPRKQNLRQTVKPAIHLTLLDQWLRDLQGSPQSLTKTMELYRIRFGIPFILFYFTSHHVQWRNILRCLCWTETQQHQLPQALSLFLKLCSKPTNAHWKNMLYHRLKFTYMLRWVLRSSLRYFRRILINLIQIAFNINIIWHFMTRGSAWDIFCNIKWFYLYSFGKCFISSIFLKSTLMMVTKTTETFWWILI